LFHIYCVAGGGMVSASNIKQPADVKLMIRRVYNSLSTEELFSKAKRLSWQTFFHHSASVASISYRLAELYKSQRSRGESIADSVSMDKIRWIESYYGLALEELAFLLGVVHDYVKLRGGGRKPGERARELLESLLSDTARGSARDRVIDRLLLLAGAVEGESVPEARNIELRRVAKVVELADRLMGAGSVDEAVRATSSVPEAWEGSLRVGYVKVSAPSILQAKVSEEVVNLLRRHGWVPLALYHDGLVVVGGRDASAVPAREVANALRSEVEKVFSVEERVRQLVEELSRKGVAEVFSKLEQTQAKVLLGGDDPTNVYHDMVASYLRGEPLSKLAELKKGRRLLSPPSLATGLGRGSKYFDELLGTVLATRESLASTLQSLRGGGGGRKYLFLALTYMVGFVSKDVGKAVEVLGKAFGVKLPKSVDKDVLYSIVMAEVYRNLDSDGVIERVVDSVFDVLGVRQEIEYYVSRFFSTAIKSNIIDAGSDSPVDVLAKPVDYRNYCRVCGAPLLSESIAFIEYARAAQARGGSTSEMWLHDDPPLASMGDIATDKETRIRFICPLCYYEASVLGREYKPPFLVVALHPAVAYDVWEWLKERIGHTELAAPGVLREVERRELARIYVDIVEKHGMKVPDHGGGKEPGLVLVDSLGARVVVPLRTDMSIKLRDVAQALVLVPYAMSVAGGGQVGLVGDYAQAYNLGSGHLPVVLPHPVPFLYAVNRAFEYVSTKAGIEGRDMTPDEYEAYNASYPTIMKSLYAYSIKATAWYSGWKRVSGGGATFSDYALDMLEQTSLVPYTPLALATPPPPSLDPRRQDEPLPYYAQVYRLSREVESAVSKARRVAEGKEPPSITSAIHRYAVLLRELKGRETLSKHAVQKPLRRAIELLEELAPILGFEEARRLAREKFIEVLEVSLGVDLSAKRRIKDESGREVEVAYSVQFKHIFDAVSEVVAELLEKRVPPSKLSRFIEAVLDVAYEKYKSVGE